jgi:hypothetical protein
MTDMNHIKNIALLFVDRTARRGEVLYKKLSIAEVGRRYDWLFEFKKLHRKIFEL